MNRFLFALLPALFLALYAAIGGPADVQAQQPREDTVVINLSGCAGGAVEWRDGMEISTRIVVDIDNLAKPAYTLVDDVGVDNSRQIDTFTAAPEAHVRARLYSGDELISEDSATIPACPTATATSTPTSTATSVPSTATPAPTSTPAPIPTPIVITNTVIQERVVTVPAASSSTSSVRPPSTGSGGLKAWDWGGWGGADSWLPCYYGHC